MTTITPSAPPLDHFTAIGDLIRTHATKQATRLALVDGPTQLDNAALDALMDRIAASLQRDGVQPGEVIALCAATSARHAAVFLGADRKSTRLNSSHQ